MCEQWPEGNGPSQTIGQTVKAGDGVCGAGKGKDKGGRGVRDNGKATKRETRLPGRTRPTLVSIFVVGFYCCFLVVRRFSTGVVPFASAVDDWRPAAGDWPNPASLPARRKRRQLRGTGGEEGGDYVEEEQLMAPKMENFQERLLAFVKVLQCREGGREERFERERNAEEEIQRTYRELLCPCAPWWNRWEGDDSLARPGVWKKVVEGWRKAAREEAAETAREQTGISEDEGGKKDDKDEGWADSWDEEEERETRKVIGKCTWAESFERGPLRQREYNIWMYAPLFSYAHAFPCWSFHLDVLGVKRALWKRWGADYGVRTIREVFPDNEIAEWVIEARKEGRKPHIVYRAEEMSYERDYMFGEVGWPSLIRPYAEEVAIQARRRYYREKEVVWDWPEEACVLPDMTQMIYEGEELPEVLLRARELVAATQEEYWRRRRNPEQARHNAKEPNMDRWDDQQRAEKRLAEERAKVSRQNTGRQQEGCTREGKWRRGERRRRGRRGRRRV